MGNFRTLLANKPEEGIALQLKELITNEMLVTMFPNLQINNSIPCQSLQYSIQIEHSLLNRLEKPLFLDMI